MPIPSEDYSVGVNKFLDENYGINSKSVTTGENLFLKTYAQYQYGMNQPMTVDASSLDFNGVTQKNLTPLENGNYGLDLYKINPTSQTSLALGKITLVSQGNNQFSILPDEYNFNIETQNGFSRRNIATFGAAILHDNPFSFIFGGSYWINFQGTITIKP